MICVKCKADISDDYIYCPWCGKKQIKTAAPKPLKRANKAGTVYKLAGRRKRPWAAAISKKVIGYYEAKSDALRALEVANSRGGISDKYNATLGQIFEEWKAVSFERLSNKSQE